MDGKARSLWQSAEHIQNPVGQIQMAETATQS